MNEPSTTSDDHGHEDQSVASRTRSRRRIVGTLNTKTLEDKRMHKNDPKTLRLMKIPTMIFFALFQLLLWVCVTTGDFTSDLCKHNLFKKTIQCGEMSR